MNLRETVNRHASLVASAGLILLLISLSLAAIHPLLFGSLMRTDDGLQHLYRLIALDQAVQHGDLWPRYIPTLVYGYGEPIFNYYSPMSLYPFEALRLIGLRFQDALLVGLILYSLIGISGAYKLGEGWGGPIMGIGAATAYAYAPYMLHNMLERGAVGEVAALALLPWALWAFHRLAQTRQRREFLIAVILLALLLLMHNITALQAIALLVVYSAFLWWTGDHPPRLFVHLGLAGVLAIGLAAFFWLPALAESSYVQLDRTRVGVNAPPDTPDFYAQFQTLEQTFAPPVAADLTQFNPPTRRTLSWPQFVLALLGIGLVLAERPVDRREALLKRLLIVAFALIAGCVFMTVSLSSGIWAVVPLLNYFQFPWRMLGPASLLLALMAGAGMAEVFKMLSRPVTRGLWLALCLAALILSAMPSLYHLYIPDPAAASVVDAQNDERVTGRLGGTARGEYIPRWVKELPDANRLAERYARSDVIPRLQPLSVVTVSAETWGPTTARLALASTEDTILTFDWLYFPGWQARVDGQETPVRPSQPNGLVTLDVPQGEHAIELMLGPTLLQTLAMLVSGLFVILVGVSLLIAPRRLWPPVDKPEARPSLRDAAPYALFAGALGLALFILKAALIDNIQSPIKQERFAGGVENGLQHPVWGVFNSQVTLLGYDLPNVRLESGKSGPITLYWQPADAVIPDDYASVVTLRDVSGIIVAQTGSPNPGGWPTSSWVPGFWVQEALALGIPPATPPGVYAINVSLYSPKSQRNLDALDGQSQPRGPLLRVGELTVTRPSAPARMDDFPADEQQSLVQLDSRLTDALALVAVKPLPTSGDVGQSFPLVAYWRADQAPGQSFSYQLVWADSTGAVAAVSSPRALAASYPTDQWQPGDLWRGEAMLHIPGKLATGIYTVSLQLIDPQGVPIGVSAELGQMVANAPPRSFAPPRPSVPTTTMWENGIRLVGYDLPGSIVRRGEPVRLTLHWQPASEIDVSLTVFAHIIDAEGNIVGQVDTLPGGGKRPTTGWAPGEYVSDTYQVIVNPGTPRGEYYIRIGWYDAATGARLTIVDGAPPDSWLLPQTIRVP